MVKLEKGEKILWEGRPAAVTHLGAFVGIAWFLVMCVWALSGPLLDKFGLFSSLAFVVYLVGFWVILYFMLRAKSRLMKYSVTTSRLIIENKNKVTEFNLKDLQEPKVSALKMHPNNLQSGTISMMRGVPSLIKGAEIPTKDPVLYGVLNPHEVAELIRAQQEKLK